MACSCYNANYYFISSMLRNRECLDEILYTCTQHGFWIVSVKHVVLFCYGEYIRRCTYIYSDINREQWCISTKPCGLKLGSLDRRCFPDIRTMREEICFEKYNWMSVSKECRAHGQFEWENCCPDEVLRKYK